MKSQSHATSYRANPDWRQLGKCREIVNAPGFDPEHDPFFPEQGRSNKIARAICAQCPIAVRQRCLEDHLNEKYGIWGGTSERDRCKIRADRRVAETQPHVGKGHYRGVVYVPARPLQKALRALVGPVFPTITQMSETVGLRAGISRTSVASFLSKTGKVTVTLAWATRIMAAARLEPADVYPESEAA